MCLRSSRALGRMTPMLEIGIAVAGLIVTVVGIYIGLRRSKKLRVKITEGDSLLSGVVGGGPWAYQRIIRVDITCVGPRPVSVAKVELQGRVPTRGNRGPRSVEEEYRIRIEDGQAADVDFCKSGIIAALEIDDSTESIEVRAVVHDSLGERHSSPWNTVRTEYGVFRK